MRFRFHGVKRSLSETEAAQATELDFPNHVALVATLSADPYVALIGAARYIRSGGNSKNERAEIAFAVLEEHQGRGLGSLLLRHLVMIGREQGVYEFQADVLSDNKPMIAVLENSGFPFRRSVEFGVERILLNIRGGASKNSPWGSCSGKD
jgi:GNAT superfamily N-acetyltransferase